MYLGNAWLVYSLSWDYDSVSKCSNCYAKIVHVGSGVTLETEVNRRHQAAALYKMASKQCARCGGTACNAINCTNRQVHMSWKVLFIPKGQSKVSVQLLVCFGWSFYQKFSEISQHCQMTSNTVVFRNRPPLCTPYADYSHIPMTWLFHCGVIYQCG